MPGVVAVFTPNGHYFYFIEGVHLKENVPISKATQEINSQSSHPNHIGSPCLAGYSDMHRMSSPSSYSGGKGADPLSTTRGRLQL